MVQGAAWGLCLPLVCISRGLQASRTLVGHALWLDRAHSQCLVLWKRLPEWAEIIYTFAQTYGLDDSVMTVDDLSDAEDTANTGSFRNVGVSYMPAVLQVSDMRLWWSLPGCRAPRCPLRAAPGGHQVVGRQGQGQAIQVARGGNGCQILFLATCSSSQLNVKVLVGLYTMGH